MNAVVRGGEPDNFVVSQIIAFSHTVRSRAKTKLGQHFLLGLCGLCSLAQHLVRRWHFVSANPRGLICGDFFGLHRLILGCDHITCTGLYDEESRVG